MGSILSFVYLLFFPHRSRLTEQVNPTQQKTSSTKKQSLKTQRVVINKEKTFIKPQIQKILQKQANIQQIKPRSKLYPLQQEKKQQYVISLDQLQNGEIIQVNTQQARQELIIKLESQNINKNQTQHYLLKIDNLIKEEAFHSTTLIWIKQGILDFKEKYVQRYKSIFNLKIFQSLEDLIFNLQNIQSFGCLPTRIICHYSIFTKVHTHFANDPKVISISIFNNELIDSHLTLEQIEQQQIRQKQFMRQKKGLYSKLGKISGQIIQMRQQIISQSIQENSRNCVHFQPYLFINNQYNDVRSISIKSALLLQKCSQISQKQRAKQDLIRLASLILDSQIYLQYLTELNRKSFQENNTKQNKKNVYGYIQEILAIFKNYPVQIIYENFLTKDKQKIFMLQDLEQLKSRPITDQIVFWKILQFFIFKQNLALNVIKQFFHRNNSPLQICYIRLMISDISMCIKQLYKLYDQKKVICECYYSAFADQNLIKNIKESVSKTIQLQQFLLCNLSKHQQMSKLGNIFFMITIKNNERQFESDHGFIKFQYFQSFFSKKIPRQKQYKNKILFNILNHFYVESITFDSICDKLIVKLVYGYTPQILKKYNLDRISLTKQELIHVYYWLNNEEITNVKDQGQALRIAKMYEYSLAFYQQALIKAKRQHQINRQKISRIHFNSGLVLRQKQIFNRAIQQFNTSMSEKQKRFGQKCFQLLQEYQQQASVYAQQQQLQRTVRTYETMLTIVNRQIKQQNFENLFFLQKKVKYQFMLGKTYQQMIKHELAEKQYIKSIAFAIQEIGQFQLLTAQIYIALSDLYLKIDQYSKATFNYKKALAIRLNIFGQFHILVAESYQKLGDSTDKDLQYEHSYRHYNSAFQIYTKFYDKEHDKVLQSYKNLGKTLYKKNYFDDAIRDFKIALQVTIKKYGSENLKTGELYYLIGECFKKKGDYLSAIQMFQKNKTLSLKLLSSNHPETNKCYKQIGQVYQKQGKYNQAIQYYEKPLMNLIKNKGQFHKDTVQYYQKLGHLYIKRSLQEASSQKQEKKYQIKGISYLKKILDIRFSLQKNSLETAGAYDSLGRAHLIKKDYKNAQGYFQQALSIKKIILKQQNDINYAISYYNFGEALILEEKYDESLKFLYKALNIKLLKLGQNHPQISEIYKSVAYCYLKKTQYNKSEENYKKSLAIKLSIYGSYNPQTAFSHYQLGNLYESKRQFQKSLQMLAKSIQTMKNLKLTQHKYYKEFWLKFIQVIKIIKNAEDLKQLRHAFYYLNNFDSHHQMISSIRDKILQLQEEEVKHQKKKTQ